GGLCRPIGGDVRIISRKRLRKFSEARRGDSGTAERDLSAWYKVVQNAEWAHFGALRQTFGSADQVGNCVVFDVGHNRFRVIGRVNHKKGILYVLRVMDHREYDKDRGADACGCHKPPPKRSTPAKPKPAKAKPVP